MLLILFLANNETKNGIKLDVNVSISEAAVVVNIVANGSILGGRANGIANNPNLSVRVESGRAYLDGTMNARQSGGHAPNTIYDENPGMIKEK